MRDNYLEEFYSFLRFPSVSTDEKFSGKVKDCAQWLSQKLSAVGLESKVVPTAGHPVVWARNKHKSGRPTVLIYGHYDVQPPDPLELWDSPPFEPVLRNLGDRVPRVVDRARRYVRRANLPNPRRFYSWEFLMAQEAAGLLDPDFRASVDAAEPYAVLQGHYDRPRATSELNRLLYLDLKLTIGDNDLLKVTRTAEMAGVAVRFPWLDRALIEFTGTWPAGFKVRGLEKRYLFKRAFQTLLAPETLAKRKHGFGVPTSV